MKFTSPKHLKDLASLLNCEFVGNPELQAHGINEIHSVEIGDIVFVDHPKYYDKALQSAATVVLINDSSVEIPEGKGILVCEEPFVKFNQLAKQLAPVNDWNTSSPTEIGEGTIIQPNVSIGKNVKIGKNSLIYSGTVLYDNTTIGNDVTIHANVVIGSDAFYFQKKNGRYTKLHSCGNSIIEDHVEIGAGCTIDRGVSHSTIIGEGSKLDNHIHVGHDTKIGKHCLIAAQVGIAGCVVIEDHVSIWGQVGFTQNITIGEGATILAQSGVGKSVEPGKTYFGSPAIEAREKFKQMAAVNRLPDLLKSLNQNG